MTDSRVLAELGNFICDKFIILETVKPVITAEPDYITPLVLGNCIYSSRSICCLKAAVTELLNTAAVKCQPDVIFAVFHNVVYTVICKQGSRIQIRKLAVVQNRNSVIQSKPHILCRILKNCSDAGSLLISIILITIIGICMGQVSLPASLVTTNAFSNLGDVTFKLDILGALKPTLFTFLLMFFMSDFFSTLGTALGVAGKAGMLDENGNLPTIGRIFLVDSCATVVGSLFGLTTVTTYVESASGVEAGGRTGLTAVVTACCFFLSMFFAPLFLMVPTAATAPALIVIGISMMQTLKDVDFKSVEWFPVGFMVIVSIFGGIANGIALGLVAYCVTHYARYLFTDSRQKAPSLFTVILTILCCLQFIG